MTAARQVIAGRTYLISRRCTQRQFLLRPEPMVENIYLYCLGEAAQRFDITLHGFIAMSNHQHILVRDNHANFPEFLAHLHKMVSKAMNSLRGRSENFWSTEQPSAVYLVDRSDRFTKLVYLLANPVADHLVERISDWPGASSLGMHLSGQPRVVRRPPRFFRTNGPMPEEITLRLERPAGFEDLSDSEWIAQLREALHREEARAREARRATGRGVLGRKAVLRALPTDSPTTIEPRRELRPHLACKEPVRRIAEITALRAFRVERSNALSRYHDGVPSVTFPYGTYRVRGVFITAIPPLAECA